MFDGGFFREVFLRRRGMMIDGVNGYMRIYGVYWTDLLKV